MCSTTNGLPVSAAERATRPGSVPYYGATGQVGYIDQAIFNESLVLLGEDGVSFLDAARPKAYAISGPSWVNNHAHVLRSDAKVLNQRYLLHYLNCFDYHDYAIGTTRLKLTKSAMTQIPVRLPPLAEQHRILAALEDHLSVIDSGFSALRAAQRKASLFAAAAREIIFRSRSHEPTVCLCEILREPLRNGYSGPVTTNGSGVRVITLTTVTRNHFSDKNTKLCDTGNRDVSELWLEPGDILIQRANTPDLVGTAALYSGEPNWAIFPDLLIRIRVNGNVLPEFLSASLSTRRIRQYFTSSAKGLAGTMPKIDQGTVGRAKLWLPSLDAQRNSR